MLSRGDSIDKVNKRLYHDNELFRGFDKIADIIIENNDFKEALTEILSYMKETRRGGQDL
ncbi:MAG: hypothetical protein LBI03_06595 [Clostridiales bacterium]|jgi:guanylate kinase|nr:hypothetical protein [Clostridiales bacterium]